MTADAPLEEGPTHAWTERSRSPEDHTFFRVTQLAILLAEVAPVGSKAIDLERLGYYDFFAANPFAILDADDRHSTARLHRAGFDERQLSYASTGSRFANRRRRLQHDVALLVAYELADRRSDGYGATERGADFVGNIAALYADQYRESVQVIHERFRNLSDSKLAESARRWLKAPLLILDLYGAGDEPSESPGAYAQETDDVAGQPERTQGG